MWCWSAFPHPSGLRGKKRPAVIVQSEVTSNLARASDPACLFIDINTPEGRATGVIRDCVVSCRVLVTVYAGTIVQTLGKISSATEPELDECLKAAMGLW